MTCKESGYHDEEKTESYGKYGEKGRI